MDHSFLLVHTYNCTHTHTTRTTTNKHTRTATIAITKTYRIAQLFFSLFLCLSFSIHVCNDLCVYAHISLNCITYTLYIIGVTNTFTNTDLLLYSMILFFGLVWFVLWIRKRKIFLTIWTKSKLHGWNRNWTLSASLFITFPY